MDLAYLSANVVLCATCTEHDVVIIIIIKAVNSAYMYVSDGGSYLLFSGADDASRSPSANHTSHSNR